MMFNQLRLKLYFEIRQKKKIVIILDGHDEYQPGTNSDIDHLIKREYLRNCGIVLSSRQTDRLPEIREYMGTEMEIKGFDEDGVKGYATRYLGSKQKCQELLQKTGKGKAKNDGILHIPIFLQMICVLFNDDGFSDILKGLTAILSEVVSRCPNWESIRKTGKKRIDGATDAILKLGRLALKGLQRDRHQQAFTKVNKSTTFHLKLWYIISNWFIFIKQNTHSNILLIFSR